MTDQTSQQALEPCPFCGSTDISEGEVLTTWGAGGTATQSMCNECGALGPEAKLPEGEVDYGDVRATAAWNRRWSRAAKPAVPEQGWINPQVRLPEQDGQLCVVLDPENDPEVWPAKWNAKDQCFDSNGGWFERDEVTGWMPLPAAPTPPETAKEPT